MIDLDRPGDRDGDQRSEDAGDLRPKEDRDQDRERRELHRAPVQVRAQRVALDHVVGDQESERDERRTVPTVSATAVTTTVATSGPTYGTSSMIATNRPSGTA